MSDDLYNRYNAAIGSLMLARRQYADTCEAHGADSRVAEQAREHLAGAIARRDAVRTEYEAASHIPPRGPHLGQTNGHVALRGSG